MDPPMKATRPFFVLSKANLEFSREPRCVRLSGLIAEREVAQSIRQEKRREREGFMLRDEEDSSPVGQASSWLGNPSFVSVPSG